MGCLRGLFTWTAVALLALTPALAADAAPLSIQVSNDGSLLVVSDPRTKSLAVYRVKENAVSMIARRDVDKDIQGESDRPVSPREASQAPPTKDVPGRDAPDFERPEKGVRVASAYSTSREGESWEVEYLVPGTLAEVYDAVRRRSEEWQVNEERYMKPPFSRAEIHMTRDKMEMSVVVEGAGRPSGWIGVQVRESRKKL